MAAVAASAGVAWVVFNGTQSLRVRSAVELPIQLTAEDLLARVGTSLDTDQFCSPKGDNVTEYVLALRSQNPTFANSVLEKVQQGLVQATKEAIRFKDASEANRLLDLIETADPANPQLATLTQALENSPNAVLPQGPRVNYCLGERP